MRRTGPGIRLWQLHGRVNLTGEIMCRAQTPLPCTDSSSHRFELHLRRWRSELDRSCPKPWDDIESLTGDAVLYVGGKSLLLWHAAEYYAGQPTFRHPVEAVRRWANRRERERVFEQFVALGFARCDFGTQGRLSSGLGHYNSKIKTPVAPHTPIWLVDGELLNRLRISTLRDI